MITPAEVVEILGPDFPQQPPATFASVWSNMKIERVWRTLRDFLPDDDVLLESVVPAVV